MRILEKEVQRELASYYSAKGYVVKREVGTDVGIIDLILYRNMGLRDYDKILIEVKEHKSIKHALGQLLSYEQYHKDCTGLGIVYFTRDGIYRGVDSIFQVESLQRTNPKLKCCYAGFLIDMNKLRDKEESLEKSSTISDIITELEFSESSDIDLEAELKRIQW